MGRCLTPMTGCTLSMATSMKRSQKKPLHQRASVSSPPTQSDPNRLVLEAPRPSQIATYGSEFVAACTSVKQIIDLRYTLRMFGVPLDGPSWLFGDNQSVITSSTLPHSTLSKRWNALSYHCVHEAIAARILRFHFIDSKQNPSDIMTKPLEHATAWPHVDMILFRKGETMPHDVDPTKDTLRGVTNSQGALG